jgi:hypothetical protein
MRRKAFEAQEMKVSLLSVIRPAGESRPLAESFAKIKMSETMGYDNAG